ncbi:unnamed protein product [Rhizophagus irregularis]|uniref:Uncharacterized protein n=1 Tax=Rhizophagus irregularis TaxID=588596 RepID=A0A916E653_9GLOM|nr:unnamed protein product [Rhizophagus irregularis]
MLAKRREDDMAKARILETLLQSKRTSEKIDHVLNENLEFLQEITNKFSMKKILMIVPPPYSKMTSSDTSDETREFEYCPNKRTVNINHNLNKHRNNAFIKKKSAPRLIFRIRLIRWFILT